VQLAFLALVLAGVFVVRGNAERWCPFGGIEGIYTYLHDGDMPCSLGLSNFYLLGAVLCLALLCRRAFCGYACPIGTISEWLGRAARAVRIKPWVVPYGLDRSLALLKYPLLAVILWLTYRAGELLFCGFDPCYALLSRHGADITFWAYAVSGAVLLGSLWVTMPFCRWLCPLAAVFHPFSRFGLGRIKREPGACLDCKECSAACPMAIPVHELRQVTVARCLSCLNCVDACPAGPPGPLAWGPPDFLGRRWPHILVVILTLLCLSTAVVAAYVFLPPSFVQTRGQVPEHTACLSLRVYDLTCRGRASLLAYFLERDDDNAVLGYLKIEAWPGPPVGEARITYDPTLTNETAIKQAIAEPYFDAAAGVWRSSPFAIDGSDPLENPTGADSPGADIQSDEPASIGE
jgi:ferredoxin